jgi:hypothetical protein
MITTAQIQSPATSTGPMRPTDRRRSTRAPASQRPAVREMLAEVVPLTGAIPFYGLPVGSVLGPWLLLGLGLAGPFACLFALVVAMIVAAMVLAALAAAALAILAAPSLLVGHVRRHRARHASVGAAAARVVTIQSPGVAA